MTFDGTTKTRNIKMTHQYIKSHNLHHINIWPSRLSTINNPTNYDYYYKTMKKGMKKKKNNKLERKGVFTLFRAATQDSDFVGIYHHWRIFLLIEILGSKESYKNFDQNSINQSFFDQNLKIIQGFFSQIFTSKTSPILAQ